MSSSMATVAIVAEHCKQAKNMLCLETLMLTGKVSFAFLPT